MKTGAIIPLVGGGVIGQKMATGQDPDFIISWPAFEANDSNIRGYMPHVPFHLLDEETNAFIGAAPAHKQYQNADVVFLLPPCAGLCSLNSAKGEMGRGPDAFQNRWMYISSNYAMDIGARAIVMENAPALFTGVGKKVRDRMIENAAKRGYSMSFIKTDTMLHGIPQQRKRTFAFFWKDMKAPTLELTASIRLSLEDFLHTKNRRNLKNDRHANVKPSGDLNDDPFHQWMLHKHQDTVGIRKYMKTQARKTVAMMAHENGLLKEMSDWVCKKYPGTPSARMSKHWLSKFASGLGIWDSSPFYADSNSNAMVSKNIRNLVVPTCDSFLTEREVMHLMGLPHDFNLVTDNIYHATQNVPCTTAADMVSLTLRVLNGDLKETNDNVSWLNFTSKQPVFGVGAMK